MKPNTGASSKKKMIQVDFHYSVDQNLTVFQVSVFLLMTGQLETQNSSLFLISRDFYCTSLHRYNNKNEFPFLSYNEVYQTLVFWLKAPTNLC